MPSKRWCVPRPGRLCASVDVEPYGPGDSDAAGQRLLPWAVQNLGPRFAQYVVVEGEFATAPFLHTVGDLGLSVVARLKENLPELFQAAQKRFRSRPPRWSFRDGDERVEMWDADDFDPWETLRWETVRVFRYRQHKPDGELVEAYWLTNFSSRRVGARTLYGMAKSRWEIENQGFNDAKNRHGLKHICHHEPNGGTVVPLRYLHRGRHPVRTAIELVRLRWLSLSRPAAFDTS